MEECSGGGRRSGWRGENRDLSGAERTRRFRTQKESLYLTLRKLGSLKKGGYSSKHTEFGQEGPLQKQKQKLSPSFTWKVQK